MADKPCPNCGHCPSCGRSNFKPWQPYQWWGTWPPNYTPQLPNTYPYTWTNVTSNTSAANG